MMTAMVVTDVTVSVNRTIIPYAHHKTLTLYPYLDNHFELSVG
jgi:hypothetical protein